MWTRPLTFFWPIFGLSFPKDFTDYSAMEYLMRMLERSFEPEFSQSFITEILGAGMIAVFILYWLRKRVKKKPADK
jgi:hypothetical protein